MTGALKVRTSTSPETWTVIGGGSFATDAETIAGTVDDKAVTPAGLNAALPELAYAAVRGLGASAAANTTIIQDAWNAVVAAGGGVVRLPAGTWDVGDLVLDLLSVNMTLEGQGVGGTLLNYTGSGTAIAQADPGSRRYNLVLRDLALTDTGTGLIGIDLDSISTGYFSRVSVSGFDVAWKLHSTVSGGAVFNRFVACTAQNAADIGWSVEAAGSNENVWIACRANACVNRGMSIVDSNHNVWTAGAIESCGVGWYVNASSNGLADTNTLTDTRLEGNTVGVNIAHANVRNAAISWPHMQGNGTDITDAGTRTQYMAGSAGIQLSGVPLFVRRAAIADDAVRIQVDGDTEYRMIIDADGTIRRGTGAATQDWSLGYSSSGPTGLITGNVSIGGTPAGLTSGQVIITPSVNTKKGLLVQGAVSQTGDLVDVRNSGGTTLSKFNKGGYFMTRINAAPADADIATSEAAIWFDNTAGAAKLMIKAKNASGTVVTGQIALA